jgi:hypothetical protein
VVCAKRGMAAFDVQVLNAPARLVQGVTSGAGNVSLPCLLTIGRSDRGQETFSFLLVEEGKSGHHLQGNGQIQNTKLTEEPKEEHHAEHYTKQDTRLIKPDLNELPNPEVKNSLVPQEKEPFIESFKRSIEKNEEEEQVEIKETAQEGQFNENANKMDEETKQDLIMNELKDSSMKNGISNLDHNKIESELEPEPLQENQESVAKPSEKQEQESVVHTPKKRTQELQQLTSELRQKTRSQQKDARRLVKHEYIYNHNSVLLGERIEDIDFGETYFTRPCRVNGKAGAVEHSSRKKRQTGAGECCICYSRFF